MENPVKPDDPNDAEGEFLALLGSVQPGWTVAVKRLLPRWCDGHLDTLDVTPEEPLDLETIKELFGGRRLQIIVRDQNGHYRGMKNLAFPDPPRDGEGRPLVPPDAPAQNNASAAFAEQLNAMQEMFRTVLQSQQTQQATMIQLLEKRIDAAERKSDQLAQLDGGGGGTYEPSSLERIQELAETLSVLEQLKGRIAPAETDAAGMDTLIKQFFELQLEREKIKLQTATAQRTAAPPPNLPERTTRPQAAQRANRPEGQKPPDNKPAGETADRPEGQKPPDNEPAGEPAGDVLQAIKLFSDDEIAAEVNRRLQTMSPAQAMALLAGATGETISEEDLDAAISAQIESKVEERGAAVKGKRDHTPT